MKKGASVTSCQWLFAMFLITMTVLFGGGALFAAELAVPQDLRFLGAGEQPPEKETPPPDVHGMKWHPGHYGHAGSSDDVPNILNDIKGLPVVRGIQVRYYWDDLEPQKDKYDFTKVRADIELLRGEGKLLAIQLQYKSFSRADPRIPSYLKTAEYEGGSYFSSAGDWNLRLWNANVRERLKALITAIGQELESNPTFVLLNTVESGPAIPEVSDPLYSNWGVYKNEYYKRLVELGPFLRTVFPTTPTVLYFNSGPSEALMFEESALEYGVGHGAPDTYVGSYVYDNWPKYGYDLAKRLKGLVPIGYGVQWRNYVEQARNVAHLNSENPIPALFEFNRDVLGSNFVFWEKRVPYWTHLLTFWKSLPVRDAAGGLEAGCPELVAPCSN
ncbi:hypothetical protein [Thiocapsa roseopersicina]|uniref:Glycoside hydrolase family 42 N-terminal domain-containing protein n=1 Tax=Thiocapsa roseopersicina TaxID=1058 RepID=A0A1H2Y3Y6_THIRO|nr:hypothetical protein [Thiocapsa roseopersicina]SDW99923.1 hypothetical protein SAMN05421783_11234 [Thiocapsa roseopersicina]